jgi:adenosylhomocysteine nucleosidase
MTAPSRKTNDSGAVARLARQASQAWNAFKARRQGRGPVGSVAAPPVGLLVFFAVPEETKFFAPHRTGGDETQFSTTFQAWLTGMGRKNAADEARRALARMKPERVVTAGFAGGLNPALKCGAVIYDQDFDAGLGQVMEELGVPPAKFHCHRRVAITAAEKEALWRSTGADAVEMESSVIRTICRELGIPSATVRVISDDATQDLPLDFNALMTTEDRINYLKLFGTVATHPRKIPKLIEFQQQTLAAARRLGAVLEQLLRADRT